MRWMLLLCAPGLLASCGPSVEAGSGADEDATGASDPIASTDPTGTSVETSTASDDSEESDAETGTDESPMDIPLAPAQHVSTELRCQDDGLTELLVEVNLVDAPRTEQCTFLNDIEDYMLIHVRDWHGNAATFDVHPGGQAQAADGEEYLEGTVSIETWAPQHPTIMRVELSGERSSYQGILDLQPCAHIPGHC